MKPFDLEDYSSTFHITHEVYLTAANAINLAVGPYMSARDAYTIAVITYAKNHFV